MKDESGTVLLPCPECGEVDELAIDSNRSMSVSQVTCDCGHSFQSRCFEENIGLHWNRHCKEKALPDERECCGTFPRTPHRSTCAKYRGKFKPSNA